MRDIIENVLCRYFDPHSTSTRKIAIEIEAVLENENLAKIKNYKNTNSGQLLTDIEGEDLIISLASNRPNEEFTELEAEKILDWANNARLDVTLLDQVLVGDLTIGINKKSEISFKITEQGKLVVEELMNMEKGKE